METMKLLFKSYRHMLTNMLTNMLTKMLTKMLQERRIAVKRKNLGLHRSLSL